MHFDARVRTGLSLLALFLLIIIILPVSAHRIETGQSEPLLSATTNVLQAGETSLHFSLQTPPFATNSTGEITIEGLTSRINDVGAPDLPFYTTYIVLPPEATAVVQLQERHQKNTAVSQVQPVPQRGLESMNVDPQALELLGLGNVEAGEVTYEKDMAVYGRNALYPTTNYTLSEPMYLRDVRLVELRLYPVRYNPGNNTITQATELDVSVTFKGAQREGLRPLGGQNDTHLRQLSGLAINADHAKNWRSLPTDVTNMPGTELPIGVNTYKIEVNEDGIYEVSGQELADKGMNLASVDPATIQMLYRGRPIAYQFIDRNSDNNLDAADAVRFYGEAFDGTRAENMFVSNNVYWLWAGGTATTIETIANEAGNGHPVTTTFTSSITKEPEIVNASTWNARWDEFPNPPDNYYWDYIKQFAPDPISKSYTIDLPNPVTDATNNYVVEFLTRENSLSPRNYTYTAQAQFNGQAQDEEATWVGIRNHNLEGTVLADDLLQVNDSGYPTNEVTLVLDSSATGGFSQFYLNRITVEYLRNLVALDDELVFSDSAAGNLEFHVEGFNEENVANVLVWDISEPTSPQQITILASNVSGSGPYTYKIGSQAHANKMFIATTTANIKSVADLNLYVPISLDAPAGGADWIAISHNDFLSAANDLSAHRAESMSTFVVNVEDVINQFGYGLNTPIAIRSYLTYAVGNWSAPPNYVTLIGDATINPRNLGCLPETSPPCDNTWEKDEKTYVVTDISFTDRYTGLVPSDHPMTLLSGSDILPDIALGRLPAQTLDEANVMVQKIIHYEEDRAEGIQGWQKNILFVSDNPDGGGNFCPLNAEVGQLLPDDFNQTHLCLEEGTVSETDLLRDDMSHWINNEGVSVLNYRGHGAIHTWAGPHILSRDMLDFWQNKDKPVIILSADCLDGYFARPGFPALGETFFKGAGDNRGSVGHWSSVGLGFTFEHSVLHESFYDGIFNQNLPRIGDAVNAAKLAYDQTPFHQSEMYGFVLLGDPAMIVFNDLDQNTDEIYLPVIIRSE